MSKTYEFLSEEQVEHFLERGFIRLPNALPEETRKAWVARGWQRLGYHPDDESTWEKPLIYMPDFERVSLSEFAPKVWGAVCELCGGAERIHGDVHFSDAFIVNLRNGADKPWRPPSPESPNWHKDGDSFRHFLDTPEQGLLSLVLWSDMVHQGGGTFVACDSVPVIARYLAAHPEGVHPQEVDPDEWYVPNTVGQRFITQCKDVIEMTGEAGDVILLHPYMLHASSQNTLKRPRFLTNPGVTLTEPMNFNRPNEDDFSLVEKGVLRGLGVSRYDFQRTAPSEWFEPPRIALQAKMKEEEKQRLARSGSPFSVDVLP